jgi:acetylornithine deacetylase/succinyl-diaminopimelate desuccinylase-like protein
MDDASLNTPLAASAGIASPSTQHETSETTFLHALIERLEEECPRRESTSADEERAQDILGDELAAIGLDVEKFSFRYSRSLYSVLALHYAIATLGSAFYLWQPLIGAALHLFVALAYLLDCHYRGFILRYCVPWGTSHNIVARLPATSGVTRRRIVFVGHADAAPTGWMFAPQFLRHVHKPWPNSLYLLRKQMLGSTLALLLLATLGVIRATTGYWFPYMYYGFTLASLIPLILLLQIVWTNRTVPGANDNLSGCAAVVLLADRFATQPLPDTECVFVITGCEEAGRGGAWALEQQMRGVWDPKTTTIIGLDTLSGGKLRYHIEGEILPIWPSKELVQAIDTVAEDDERFAGISPYHAPAGATDIAPFVCKGYDGACITRIDPNNDLPPNYHTPADNIENLNASDVRDAVDFAERLARTIAAS